MTIPKLKLTSIIFSIPGRAPISPPKNLRSKSNSGWSKKVAHENCEWVCLPLLPNNENYIAFSSHQQVPDNTVTKCFKFKIANYWFLKNFSMEDCPVWRRKKLTGSVSETRTAPKPGMVAVRGLNTILAVPRKCQFLTCPKTWYHINALNWKKNLGP